MNKYYLRSIREDGFGECVLPTEKFGRADHWNIESEMEHNNAYEAFMEHLSSLPVSALAHPELAKKIGWVENYEVHYQEYDYENNYWEIITKQDYDDRRREDGFRILLVEKKQEEKSENKLAAIRIKEFQDILDAKYKALEAPEVGDLFASFYQVALRNGVDTNWEALTKRIKIVLDLLHNNGVTAKTFRSPTPPVSGEPGGLQDELWEEIGSYLDEITKKGTFVKQVALMKEMKSKFNISRKQ